MELAAQPWIWARLAARLEGNQPSPVRKVRGLAVWESRMFFPDVVGWVARDGPKREAAIRAGLGPGYSGESPRMGMVRDVDTLGVRLLGEYAAGDPAEG